MAEKKQARPVKPYSGVGLVVASLSVPLLSHTIRLNKIFPAPVLFAISCERAIRKPPYLGTEKHCGEKERKIVLREYLQKDMSMR